MTWLEKSVDIYKIGPRLPVQLSRFNIAETVGLGRGQKQKIGGNKLVILHPDDVTHLDFVPALFHRLAIAQDVRLPIIDLRVTSMSLLKTGEKKGKTKINLKKN